MKEEESIWYKRLTPEEINARSQNTIEKTLGIKITEVGLDYVKGTMPADSRTFQPTGRIHGGANVVLAESLGSIGAWMSVDYTQYMCFGQEVNANHVRGVSSGVVTGTARRLYKGRTSQVWDIQIEDERGKLSCISRLTVAVVRVVD